MIRESHSADPSQVGALAARMAAEAAAQPETRLLALGALRSHWPREPGQPSWPNPRGCIARYNGVASAYVAALAAWAQSIAVVREPVAVGEVVCAPWRTVLYRAGDCDDVACAVAAFAAVVGLPAAVGIERGPDGNAHAVALVGDDWTNDPANRGRLTHVIDQRGIRPASQPPTSASLEVYPVSLGK